MNNGRIMDFNLLNGFLHYFARRCRIRKIRNCKRMYAGEETLILYDTIITVKESRIFRLLTYTPTVQ